ncbi:GNAT family N-acetyltransferase [Saccharopolyspora sp. CA-218241]|uniref:GNAT family N-acetyltransferase n=1 Tax=Saccharopolyspora sp. CA-218241 TaxID=3240027 RepID=UPI003D98366A
MDHVLELRAVRAADEVAFRAAQRELAAEDFDFGPGLTPDMPWDECVAVLAPGAPPLLPGFVPGTFLLAVVDGEIAGGLSVRHELNDHLRRIGGHIGYAVLRRFRRRGYGTELLRRGLRIARDHGVERVLVTCAEGNAASAAVIERCGGRLESVAPCGDASPRRRYWVEPV